MIRRGANEGRTTSPDDFLKWDMPKNSLNAEPSENGVYGATELLDLDDVAFRNKYTWQPVKGLGSVSGHAFFEEQLSCATQGEFSCPAGGECVNSVCRFPAKDVLVQVIGGDNNTVVTDAQGFFEFPAVRAGAYQLNAYSQKDFVGDLFPYRTPSISWCLIRALSPGSPCS